MLECSSSAHKRRTKNMKKKKGVEEHENTDKISDLPEPLLHHIFSFLDIKQAIHTCILSRRWRYFWVSLTTLNFNYSRGIRYLKTINKSDFMDFVDRVLLLHESSNIQKLAVVVKGRYDITDRLDTWIRISVLRNIQELSLRVYTGTCIWEFIHCLSNCKSLTKLVLVALYSNTKIIPDPGSFTLPRLKSLSIENAFSGRRNSIDGFISERCLPVLETLILIDVGFLVGSLNISSLTLKHLRLESCKTHSVDIHLDSPNLISFYYMGSIFKHWIIENLSSLVKADIEVDRPIYSEDAICYAQQTTNILRELHNVEELTLSLDSLKISTEAPELFDIHSMLFLKLKCLKLKCAELSVELLRLMAYLLNACPYIETLCLRVQRGWRWDHYVCMCQYCDAAYSSLLNQEDCWVASISLECLKFFEFRNVRACVIELNFIEILLNKAVMLEKLFIVFGFGERSSDAKRYRIKFREKVLTFPRTSSSAAIVFK